MRTAAAVLIAMSLLAGCLPEPHDLPRVEANGEMLVGQWDGVGGSVASFKGIPFAAPPVGELRWRAPRPPEPRPGEQYARTFAPACMQGEHMTQWYAGVAEAFGADPGGVGRFTGVSEDCLYLNIWTPKPAAVTGLPVMVWVHGGSNAGGWSYEPNYIGDRLAARGVVVVTVSYRVGPFGFFAHPKLENEPGAPIANFGWLDIAAAVRWVKNHIGKFGGDADNVTLIGESSGAANILDFAVQEEAGNLGLNRLILQSTPNRFEPRRNILQAMEEGEQLVAFLDLPSESLTASDLRSIPAEDLLAAAAAVKPDHYFDVVRDAVTLLRTPREALESPRVGQLDLLIGTNANEWLMYLDDSTRAFDVDHWLFRNAPGSSGVLREMVDAETDARRALDRLETASNMACPSRFLAERVSAAGGRAWVYWFSRQRPGPGGERLGAYHGTEIAYVFDQHEYWQSRNARDDGLTRTVMDYWVSFARNGDPNRAGRPEWPMYVADRPEVLELGDQVGAVPPPDQNLCLWLGPGGSAGG